jgi:nicotinate-nucleotide adenylyltransferase
MPTRSSPPIAPLKLPRGVRHVLVFGGSFDPPHARHFDAPLSVVSLLYGERGYVLYVPAARNPLKAHAPNVTDEHRVAMLQLDRVGREQICGVWADELNRAREGKPSYTIDTLRRLRRIVPAAVELRLLIGMDQAAQFHRWKNPRAIIRIAQPLVMARPPLLTAFQLATELDRTGFWTRAEVAAWCSRLAPNLVGPDSSTSVRDALRSAPAKPALWKGMDGLRHLSPTVARYIVDHHLYGVGDKAKTPGRARGSL